MSWSPTPASDRMLELDVLRGFALLGVFIVHFTVSAYYELPLDEAQSVAWAVQPRHATALFITEWLFYDKANTLFATLFGMGFWIMLERLRARSDDFERIYLRRLFVLMAMGFANLFFIFPGDVLHEYAMIGLALFLARGLSARAMLIVGLVLALAAVPVLDLLTARADFDEEKWYVLQQEAFSLGGYWDWVSITVPAHLERDLLRLGLVSWASYLLGRFFLGAWIIRERWIQRAVGAPQAIARWLPWVLGGGLAMEFLSLLIYMGRLPGPGWLEGTMHALGAPLAAVGYALCLLRLLDSRHRDAVLACFVPVGRMALTAYVLHGAVFTLVYMPFGLDLLGILGPAASFALALALYAALTRFAQLWLARYRFGPLEYLWRWATYGVRPPLHLVNRGAGS